MVEEKKKEEKKERVEERQKNPCLLLHVHLLASLMCQYPGCVSCETIIIFLFFVVSPSNSVHLLSSFSPPYPAPFLTIALMEKGIKRENKEEKKMKAHTPNLIR